MLSQWLESCATDTKVISSNLIHVYIYRETMGGEGIELSFFANIITRHIKGTCLYKVLHFDCRSKIWGSIPPCLLYLTLTSLMAEQDTSNIWIQVQVLGKNSL